jgi:hypothetical protein
MVLSLSTIFHLPGLTSVLLLFPKPGGWDYNGITWTYPQWPKAMERFSFVPKVRGTNEKFLSLCVLCPP